MKRIASTLLIALSLMAFISGCTTTPTSLERTSKPTTTPEPEPTPPPSQWDVRYFVDEFGDETDEAYVQCKKITGTFSNTATSNSRLYVYVSFEEGNYKGGFISFRLLEYGSHKATHFSSERIEFMFKIEENGESVTHYMTLTAGSDMSSDVYTWEEQNEYDIDDFHAFIDALKSEQTFPCRIDIGDSSEYHFTIDGTGFEEAVIEMEELNNQQGGQ